MDFVQSEGGEWNVGIFGLEEVYLRSTIAPQDSGAQHPNTRDLI